jgi:hypothetical protein
MGASPQQSRLTLVATSHTGFVRLWSNNARLGEPSKIAGGSARGHSPVGGRLAEGSMIIAACAKPTRVSAIIGIGISYEDPSTEVLLRGGADR